MTFMYSVYQEISDRRISLKSAVLSGYRPENLFIDKYVEDICRIDLGKKEDITCSRIRLNIGFPDDIKQKIKKYMHGERYFYDEEAYCIEAGEVTDIYAETESGLIYAVSTIKELILEDSFKEVFLYDRPYVKMRAMRFFIPGRDHVEFFKQMIDEMLVRYKYNYVWFEVGGAMEYKRHPKINEEWEKYCKELLAESGVGDRIQHYTYPWSKNAIHPENGGGSYLTQEEMKELIKYCQERGLKVYPMIPLLAHSDYIVRAYPELNERVEDKHPDTYCPSNPKTYEVVFDIIDEVLEVFEDTEYVSIGHDEVVTIGICDRCKDKDPVDLFVGDIQKIYDYLKKRNKKVIIACDKFTKLTKEGKPYIDEKGKLCGGLQGYEKGDPRYVPALHTAIDRIPEDIVINDWYWQFNFDQVFKNHRVILGNFSGRSFKDWQKRSRNHINVEGISTSNFGRADYINLQRNCVIFTLIYNAYVGWDETYDNCDKETVQLKVLKELNTYYRSNILKMDSTKKYITIEHTTDHYMPYHIFYDGDYVVEEEYHIGDYVITYSDGTVHRERVLYGENISNEKLDINTVNGALIEVAGMTVPKEHDGKTYYKWTFENPYPDKVISDITFKAAAGGGFQVFVREIEYT